MYLTIKKKKHLKSVETNCDKNDTMFVNKNVKNRKNLSLYYQNVRGLRTKCSEFYLSSSTCNFDVIALSETWLNSSFYDSELFHSDFTVYRCDRSLKSSVCSS